MGGEQWCAGRRRCLDRLCRLPIYGLVRGWCWRGWGPAEGRGSPACFTSIEGTKGLSRSCGPWGQTSSACTRQPFKNLGHVNGDGAGPLAFLELAGPARPLERKIDEKKGPRRNRGPWIL